MTKDGEVFDANEKRMSVDARDGCSSISRSLTRLALLTGSFSLIDKVVLDGLIN